MSSQSTYQVYLNRWRSFGGFEDLVTDWDCLSWTQLVHVMSKRQYQTNRDGIVSIKADWNKALMHAQELKSVYLGSPEKIAKYFLGLSLEELEYRPSCEVVVSSTKDEGFWTGIDYVKYFLYECFLMMNLSSPGSFNLYGTDILRMKDERQGNYFRDEAKMECSEYIFENALHDSLNHKWPVVQHIDLEQVADWYLAENMEIVQVAKTRVQKSLFSLLHISEKGMSFDSLMWSAYCLESLFDTPNVLSYNSLVRRISELLEAPESKKKVLSKKIRNFYDHRNSFAHGKSKIVHPIGHEGWDKSVDNYRGEVQEACDFANLIIISSLQQYVLKNLREIQYVESTRFVER